MNKRCAFELLTLLIFLTQVGASAEEATHTVLRSTFKLFNQDSTATCFLLHDPSKPKKMFLATSGHVLEKAGGEEAVLVLRDAQDDGTFRRNDVPIRIREGGKNLWTKHEKEDVAVLPLKLPETVKVDSLPITSLATEEDIRDEKLDVCSGVWVFGFPARLESNGAGFPIARNATIASYPLIPVKHHRTYMIDCSTFAGDSGGPVFVTRKAGTNKGAPLVVGMVVAQYRNDEKIVSTHEERLIRHRLSLGKIVQAAFIRQAFATANGGS